MKVVFESPPVPTVRNRNGQSVAGTIGFRLVRYDAGEPLPTTPDGQRDTWPAASWRSGLKPGQALTIEPPPDYAGVPSIVIPSAVLQTLADDTEVRVQWFFRRTGS